MLGTDKSSEELLYELQAGINKFQNLITEWRVKLIKTKRLYMNSLTKR